jgi:hypothetical protein
VRRLDPRPDEAKYVAITGSTRGFAFPFGEVAPGVDALICEGELDALLAQQELGHIVNVFSVGGAEQAPRPEALAALAGCPMWLIVPDRDQAGERALAKWQAIGGRRVVPRLLPSGKDLTEAVQQGLDLVAWLADEYRLLGRPPPRAPPGGT